MNAAYKRRVMRERRAPRRGMPWWLMALIAIGALAAVGAATGLGVTFAMYSHYSEDYVPIEEKLTQRFAGLTEVYDRNGILLGTLPNPDAQLLDPVPLEAISQNMVDATVSTEDNSFWSNPGINFRGLVRAAWENYTGDFGEGSGGSSITQQLIKNVYLSDECHTDDTGREVCVAPRTVERKLKEIAYALELEQDVTKEQIMQWYLNQTSYADRYVGVEAAADGYFRKSASELTLGEAALLAGIPQSPSLYHPRSPMNCEQSPEGSCVEDELGRTIVSGEAKARQESVLDLMVEHGWRTQAEVDAAKAEVLKVYTATDARKASAFLDNQVEPRLIRMCKAGWLPLAAGAQTCEESVRNGGYRVTSSLDWTLTEEARALAQQEIALGLEAGCKCYNASIVTIDPRSGEIVVYVSNLDPANTADPRVNGVIDQATEINQPGSSFKPAVYLAWFEYMNKAPLSTFWDTSPLNIGDASIVNPRPGGGGEGLITARAGLGGSQNVPAVRAAIEATPDNVIEMAKRLGITTLEQGFDPTFVAHADITYGPSIATGGANIRVVDMAYMETVFANMGAMVGTPTLTGDPINLDDLKGTFTHPSGEDLDEALEQQQAFARGDLRLPGTRTLDPIVILKVEGPNGELLWEQGEPERQQVVDAGSVWLLHSIMSDCRARAIIWGCGGSNRDNSLDFFIETGVVPAGVKTGTQQGFTSRTDTLETWTTGYSRYAGTALWVGNSNNENVYDGGFAAAHATLYLYKEWMADYHSHLLAAGEFTEPAGFSDLQPANVTQGGFRTVGTDRTVGGGAGPNLCDKGATGWYRTDVTYASNCETATIDTRNGLLAGDATPAEFRDERRFVILPSVGREQARALARSMGIPVKPDAVSSGATAVAINDPSNGETLTGDTVVTGSINAPVAVDAWTLEIGAGSNPGEWIVIGSGSGSTSGPLGTISVANLADGVYTIRLTAKDKSVGDLTTRVTVNINQTVPTPTSTPSPSPGTPFPGVTPTPPGGFGGDDDDD